MGKEQRQIPVALNQQKMDPFDLYPELRIDNNLSDKPNYPVENLRIRRSGEIEFKLTTSRSLQTPPSTTEIPIKPKTKKERKGKPNIAYMSGENLNIIRKRIGFDGSNEQLAMKLVVFVGGFKEAEKATEIVINQREEIEKRYLVKLNNSTIAREVTNIDDWTTPFGYKMYECLGVFDDFKDTGKVSTDKSTRDWSTFQKYIRENGELVQYIKHPEPLHVRDTFFARPDDAVEVRQSRYEKTAFWWQA